MKTNARGSSRCSVTLPWLVVVPCSVSCTVPQPRAGMLGCPSSPKTEQCVAGAAARATEFRRCAKIKGTPLCVWFFYYCKCIVFIRARMFHLPLSHRSLALIMCACDWKIWNWGLFSQSHMGHVNSLVYSWFAVFCGKLILWNSIPHAGEDMDFFADCVISSMIVLHRCYSPLGSTMNSRNQVACHSSGYWH